MLKYSSTAVKCILFWMGIVVLDNIIFMQTDANLDRFLVFADNLSVREYKVTKEDWGDMCGITIIRDWTWKKDYMLFNFYGDGSLRYVHGYSELEPDVPEKSLLRKIIKKFSWG